MPLAVVQIIGHLRRHGHGHLDDGRLLRDHDQRPHDVNAHAIGRFDHGGTAAAGAVLVGAALQAGSDPLPRHFHQAEGTGAKDLRPRAVAADRVAQASYCPRHDYVSSTSLEHG